MKHKAGFLRKYGREIGLLGLAVLGLVNIMTYSNLHLYLKAKRDVGNLNEKIRMLDSAASRISFNDGVYHEKGKAYFQLGMQNISDTQKRDVYLTRSLENLILSVRLNPGFYQTHFHLAQAMMYMNYFSDREFDYIAEFKKAALLNNFDQKAYFEVGRILLSRWPDLQQDDRTFCLSILKKITKEAGLEELRSIIRVWAAVVKDYRVMDQLLPHSSRILRMYADLLGEMSLDEGERKRKLAEAEKMEISEAMECLAKAQSALRFYRFSQAEDLFSTALDKLENIRFYQELAGDPGLDTAKVEGLKRSARLGLLKAKIGLKRSFSKVRELFCSIVDTAGGQEELKELEDFLTKRKVIERGRILDITDQDRTICRLVLDFARHRYQDIIRFSESIKAGLFLSDAGPSIELSRIYEILGDSYSKLDYIYDAGEFYMKALDIDPDNADVLKKLLAHYQRLNRAGEAEAISKRLDSLLTPREMVVKNSAVRKGQIFQLPLRIEEETVEITLDFDGIVGSDPALITLYFNGTVLWEDYVSANILSVDLHLLQGENWLEIKPVNRGIELSRVSWRPNILAQ
jgi:tetratricopeptide (TPR) repeat protein